MNFKSCSTYLLLFVILYRLSAQRLRLNKTGRHHTLRQRTDRCIRNPIRHSLTRSFPKKICRIHRHILPRSPKSVPSRFILSRIRTEKIPVKPKHTADICRYRNKICRYKTHRKRTGHTVKTDCTSISRQISAPHLHSCLRVQSILYRHRQHHIYRIRQLFGKRLSAIHKYILRIPARNQISRIHHPGVGPSMAIQRVSPSPCPGRNTARQYDI